MNRRAQLICAWTGPLLTVLFAIGAVLTGRFIPPLIVPSDTAEMVAAKVAEHGVQIRIGALITIISMSLVAPWGVSIAAQTRRLEGKFPILTYVQLMCVSIGTVVVVLMSMFWAVASFRPDTYSPETMQFANDVAYFLFLFTWPPFSVWVLAVALAILLDKTGQPVYPRWVAYLCLWVCVLFMPAGMMAFFKTGIMAWNGLLALYIPVGIFFVWLAVMTWYTIKNINAGAYYDEDTDQAAGEYLPPAASLAR
jgi:hypothetical protein